MKYVVAVSGGVDSMVLLDMLVKSGEHELVVAHFDHGIRLNSVDDAKFVAEAAERYGLRFEVRREELGVSASEELARSRRYQFLKELAGKYGARVVTAHHLDDVVESIAINITRGTGWRGLAVMGSDIDRPLLDFEKKELIDYAELNDISWQEDETNSTDTYLRNRVRARASSLPLDVKRQLRALQSHQESLRKDVANEVSTLISTSNLHSRYLLTNIDSVAALEYLRQVTNAALTRPQLARALNAVKVSKPGAIFEAGNGIVFRFTPRHFSL